MQTCSEIMPALACYREGRLQVVGAGRTYAFKKEEAVSVASSVEQTEDAMIAQDKPR